MGNKLDSCYDCSKETDYLPPIFAEAYLDPIPVAKSQSCADRHDPISRNRPWRTEKQQIQAQENRRGQVKSGVNGEGKSKSIGNEKFLVYKSDAPVQNGDDYLQRRGHDGECIFPLKEHGATGHISGSSEYEC